MGSDNEIDMTKRNNIINWLGYSAETPKTTRHSLVGFASIDLANQEPM